MHNVHIDYETYSEAPIGKFGTWAYAAHESTQMLCLAYCIDDEAPQLTTDPAEAAGLIHKWLRGGYMLHAWNSLFELAISYNVLRVKEALDVTHWTDTAAAAAAMALPRSLGNCGAALGMPQDLQKDKRGKYLIQKLCVPGRTGQRLIDDDLLQELYNYCKQDVVAERAIGDRLMPLSKSERAVWECDQRINIRGVYVDIDAVDDALYLIDDITTRLNAEVVKITDGALANVSQRTLVLDYINDTLGYPLKGYTKQDLEDAIADPALPPVAKRLLEIRQATGKTSTAKYAALKNITCADHRAHGLLMYHGASTGRWTGKLFQPQNLPRPAFYDTDGCIELFAARDPEAISLFYGEPMTALSSCLRGMIMAPSGSRLVVADYSAIEARVIAWLAGQDDVLQVFRTHGKLYEHTAAKIYGVSIDDVTKSQRQIGKVASLALGYQGAVGAFQNMAKNYGLVVSDDDAARIKDDYRNAHTQIVALWGNLDSAAITAVRTGDKQTVGNVAFKTSNGFLFCRLPSGRLLAYASPRVEEGKFGNDQVTYLGINSYSRKWERQAMYGGKWAENVTQAAARDLMAQAMLRVEAAGYRVVFSVHDELIAEADNGRGSVDEFIALMCELPDWAKGLPVNAAGFESRRYKKD